MIYTHCLKIPRFQSCKMRHFLWFSNTVWQWKIPLPIMHIIVQSTNINFRFHKYFWAQIILKVVCRRLRLLWRPWGHHVMSSSFHLWPFLFDMAGQSSFENWSIVIWFGAFDRSWGPWTWGFHGIGRLLRLHWRLLLLLWRLSLRWKEELGWQIVGGNGRFVVCTARSVGIGTGEGPGSWTTASSSTIVSLVSTPSSWRGQTRVGGSTIRRGGHNLSKVEREFLMVKIEKV